MFQRNNLSNITIKCSNLNSADLISVKCEISGFIYCFVCAYRLNFCSVNAFLEEFSGFLENQKHKNLIVVGDLNIDLLTASSESDSYLSLMPSFGLVSLLNVPTRVVQDSSTCLGAYFF